MLNAMPDQYLVIARKKNDIWWVGGITGNTARTLQIPFIFLGEGNWKADIYQNDLKLPFDHNGIVIKSIVVNPSVALEIPLAAGGGFAVRLEKQ